uniref:NADH-ubiquinone oxidoreductase chain 3 n=1 Tax=Philanthus triangulum TaxID=280486 RepID=H9A9I9_9HYME|nr:NADH dehydrogenase subunit 3 [Philanthus triangulum]AET62614.1 NADH dehydrogenase subunit 3 [Philanthus triangulum]QNV11908.1 NADH dehydrogenase subunit 3 [Philanthus triangulum]
MKSMMIISFLFIMISILILMLNLLFSKKSSKDREKMTPFECGFDPLTNSRLPFSIQFFLISLMFLIFDIEIILLLPMIFFMKMKINLNIILMFITFLSILILSTYLEWLESNLNWVI